jgi:hypothetical protein
MCAEDVPITRMANNIGKTAQMLRLQHIQSISYKMTHASEKDYRACSNTSFILSVAWTASTGADRGRGLPSFLPPAWTGLLDSIRLLVYLCQRKASLSRLMVATQQVGEKMTRGLFNKVVLTRVWLAESGGYDLCQKLLWLILSYKLFSLKRDIEPTTELSYPIFIPKISTHRLYDPWSIVPHIWTKSVHR